MRLAGPGSRAWRRQGGQPCHTPARASLKLQWCSTALRQSARQWEPVQEDVNPRLMHQPWRRWHVGTSASRQADGPLCIQPAAYSLLGVLRDEAVAPPEHEAPLVVVGLVSRGVACRPVQGGRAAILMEAAFGRRTFTVTAPPPLAPAHTRLRRSGDTQHVTACHSMAQHSAARRSPPSRKPRKSISSLEPSAAWPLCSSIWRVMCGT